MPPGCCKLLRPYPPKVSRALAAKHAEVRAASIQSTGSRMSCLARRLHQLACNACQTAIVYASESEAECGLHAAPTAEQQT